MATGATPRGEVPPGPPDVPRLLEILSRKYRAVQPLRLEATEGLAMLAVGYERPVGGL